MRKAHIVKLTFEESIGVMICSRRKMRCLQVPAGISVIFICSVYLSLWLSLHPPNLSECEDSCYFTYLLIVENIFLMFGIYLTLPWGDMSHAYQDQRKLIRRAFMLSIVTGIIVYWIRTLGRTREEKVMISAILSFLYVSIFIFITEMIPLIKYRRRLTARTDVPSLPKDPDAPLSVIYY